MIEDEIYEFIDRGGGITFVELIQRFPASKGDREYAFEGKNASNIVFWSGISSEFIQLMENLLNSQRIVSALSNMMVYVHDGAIMDLPLVKSVRHYKKSHWLPIVFWSDRSAKAQGFFETNRRKTNFADPVISD